MRRFFRRATLDELAAAGKTDRLLRALAPRDEDFVGGSGRELVDVGADRRASAARLLASVDGENVTGAFVERLQDPTLAVRLAALRGLVGRPAPQEPAMVAAVVAWPESEARAQGAALLVERADGDSGAAARIVDAYVNQGAVPALDADWARLVFDAVDGPARQQVVQRAVRRIHTHPEASPAARQLLAVDEALSVGILLEMLDDGEPSGHLTGTVALLGDLRNSTATGPLVELLRRADPRGREAAAEALGRIQDPRAVEALLHCAADSVFSVRDSAQRALDALGTAGVVWSVAAAARGALDGADALLGAEETRRLLETPVSEG